MSMVTIELQPLRRPAGSTWSRDVRRQRADHEVYVRRRAVVVLVLLVLAALATVAVRSWSGPTAGDPASAVGQVPAAAAAAAGPTRFVVQPGDTLWSIAEEFVGDGDIARYVDDLAALNGDDPLIVGELVVLPG